MAQNVGNTKQLQRLRDQAADNKLIGVSDGEREHREAFNCDIGKARLILVVSPT